MGKKSVRESKSAPASGKPSALVDTRVVYCGDNLDQLRKLPDECVDLIYIDPPFNPNRNYEVFDETTQLGVDFGTGPETTKLLAGGHGRIRVFVPQEAR